MPRNYWYDILTSYQITFLGGRYIEAKRRDDKGRVLLLGESQDKDGRYRYRYTDALGKRQTIYSWRLTEADDVPEGRRMCKSLREKERKVLSLQLQGVTGSKLSIIELVERYISLKTGVKHNTMANYRFVVNLLKKEEFAYRHVEDIKLSDAKIFLSRKRQALSEKDQERFLDFVKNDPHYSRYYDGFFILFKTGLRISEFCGLTVRDLDFDNDIIDVNHQLQRTRKMKYVIESTKTTSGTRKLPMTEEVRDAFLRILENRQKPKREPIISGYGGFLFLDKDNKPTVALHWEHYMRDARNKFNSMNPWQLPPISPHICRHTYCSDMAKTGITPKTLQYLMGHSDVSVTLNVYTHVGVEDARAELARLNEAKADIKAKTAQKSAQKIAFFGA